VAVVLLLCVFAIAFHGGGFHFTHTDPDGTVHFSGSLMAVQFLAAPLNLLSTAYFVLLVAWIYNAGKYADSQR
jgi:hypothetical protein